MKTLYITLAALLACGVTIASAGQLSTTWTLRNVVDPPDLRDGLNADAQAADARLDTLEDDDMSDGGTIQGVVYAVSTNGATTNIIITVDGELNGEAVADDTIDEDSIDFGTGTDQVSASDMPDEDLGAVSVSSGVWSIDDRAVTVGKLPAMTDNQFVVGDSTDSNANVVTVSGDIATISAAGAVALADGAVPASEVGAGTLPSDVTGADGGWAVVALDASGGITASGSPATGISFNSTNSGSAIDLSGASIDPDGSSGPAFIKLGSYASPYDYGADDEQSGVFRIYTTCSGTASYDRCAFFYTEETSSKGGFPMAALVEVNNTGTGPTKVQAGQFIAHLGAQSAGATLPTIGVDSTAGFFGLWCKVTSANDSVQDSGSLVAALWVDNVMYGSNNGTEYGIYSTAASLKPDGWAGFHNWASGYDQLFYFDDTYTNGAGTCVTTDASPTNQTARIRVWYDGTQYYLSLYED